MNPRIGASPRRPKGAEETLRVLNAFAVSLLQQNRLDDLLWSIAENVGTLLGFEDSVIYLATSNELRQYAAFGAKNPRARQILNPIVIPFGSGVVGRVAETREPQLIRDTSKCDYYVRDAFAGLSEISIPILYQDRTIAVIDAEASARDAYDEHDLELLTSFANLAAPRIASALEEEQRRSIEDELTRAKSDLEERVARRTAALASSVAELRNEVNERRRVESALANERQLLRLSLQSIGDGLFATNANDEIVLASDAALRLTGTTRSQAIGRSIGNVYRTRTASDDGTASGDDAAPPSVTRFAHSNATASRASTRILDSLGEERILDEVVSPIRNADGETIGVVVVFRDVTLERALERKAQKTQRLESLGVLAGGIAHDFNNVLAGILGRVNLAQMSGADEELRRALRDAEEGCITARSLTKELLAFAKGGAPVKNIESLRSLIVDSARFCLHGSSVNARLELDDDLYAVEMDAVQVGQALNNIILNAVQAMPEGGELVVQARNADNGTDASRGEVIVTITDSGPGIDERIADRIFDPYFSTKSAHSGLGLATSYWIIQRHGGQLRLGENSKRGTTFEIRLPAATSDTLAPPLPASRSRKSKPFRVLLMDDEDVVRETVAAMLERIGQTVEVASNGEEAIELFERAAASDMPFDAAFLDLTVRGGMGGLRTLERLRAIMPNFAAVVVSGYSDDPVLAKHREHGFDERLQKPFTLSQLRAVLGNLAHTGG